MESSLWNGWGIDPAYIIIALAVLTLVLLVAVLVCIGQYRKLYRRYDIFMRGKDAETLEDTIEGLINETDFLRSEDRAVKDLVKSMNKKLRASYQKTGIVRYNAFKGMGGNLSFVLALLDDNNSGFILNSVHSREGCYLYLKDVDKGQTDTILGSEEKEALEQALGY